MYKLVQSLFFCDTKREAKNGKAWKPESIGKEKEMFHFFHQEDSLIKSCWEQKHFLNLKKPTVSQVFREFILDLESIETKCCLYLFSSGPADTEWAVLWKPEESAWFILDHQLTKTISLFIDPPTDKYVPVL